MTSKPTIRVLCVDDHDVVREGIAAMVRHVTDIEVIANAADGAEALRQYVRHQPDVTLMDLRMRGMSGFDAIRAIRKHDQRARILVLTMYEGDEDIYRALQAGASGYLFKDRLGDTLVTAIREVFAGRRALAESAASNLANRVPGLALTAREVQVLQLLANGMGNKEIATALRIVEDTVYAHVKSIFVKFDVHDRTAAVGVAVRRGIVHID